MYINSRYFVFSIIFAVILSCNTSTGKYNAEKQEFSEYLKKVFSQNISKDKSCYLILPGISCVGCTKYSAKAFENSLSKPNHYIISGIMALNYVNTADYKDKIMIDTLAEILNLKLTKNQVTLIYSSNHTIDKIFHINTSNLDSLDIFLSYNE